MNLFAVLFYARTFKPGQPSARISQPDKTRRWHAPNISQPPDPGGKAAVAQKDESGRLRLTQPPRAVAVHCHFLQPWLADQDRMAKVPTVLSKAVLLTVFLRQGERRSKEQTRSRPSSMKFDKIPLVAPCSTGSSTLSAIWC